MKRAEQESLTVEKFTLLMKLIGRINSNLKIEKLLHNIMHAVNRIENSEASSLMLYDKKTNELLLSVPTGPATAEVSGQRFSADQGIAGWVVTHKDSQIVNNLQEDDRFLGDFNPDVFETRNLICVPMINQEGEVIGCLQALNKKDGTDFDSDDLFVLQALANQAAIAIETTQLHKERLENERIKKQLELARKIQTIFWPKSTPDLPGYDIAGTSQPAREVGGDYYDFISLPESNRWGIAVADVAGKGYPAALLMATVRTSLRTQLVNNYSIQDTVKLVNQGIYEDSPIDKFITMFYGELDPGENTFEYINAGHNLPYLVDFNENEITPLSEGGVMLGIQEQASYEKGKVKLKPGQQIIMYSDGVPEATNEEDELYGNARLKNWLLQNGNKNSSALISSLLKEVEEYQQSTDQSDDITIVNIKRKRK